MATRPWTTMLCVAIVAVAIHAPPDVRAEKMEATVGPVVLEPLGDDITRARGAGGDIQFSPCLLMVSVGGFAVFGERANDRVQRDVYDFHVNAALSLDPREHARLRPFIGLGVDVLSITTRAPKSRPERGTTLGVDVMGGITGRLGDHLVFRASATYLGAIVPGSGDELSGLAFQLGVGSSFR